MAGLAGHGDLGGDYRPNLVLEENEELDSALVEDERLDHNLDDDGRADHGLDHKLAGDPLDPPQPVGTAACCPAG